MHKILVCMLVAVAVLASCANPSLAQSRFKPAEISSTSEIQHPINSIASGVVILDVSLDDKGTVTGSTVVHDIPSLTSVATSSAQRWTFIPASTLGVPEASVMRIAFVFRPPSYSAGEPRFSPILFG
jgi:hypothetical protein